MGKRTIEVALLSAWCSCTAVVALGACVGDDPPSETSPDAAGANETGAPPDASVSEGDGDGGADAADARPTTCDPNKPFGNPKRVNELNTTIRNNTLVLSPDGKTAFFSADRDGGQGFFDIYVASRPTLVTPFANALVLPKVNGSNEDYHPTVSGDGRLLVFESDRSGTYQLWRAGRASAVDDFSTPVAFDAVNPAGAPFLREDGNELYFNRGTTTDGDIWRSEASGGTFGAPTVVDELNTPSNEDNPVVTPDDLVIYWASTRQGGGGSQHDIWMASRGGIGEKFVGPTPVTELNTAALERPTFITADRCTLFFDRNDQFYVATKTP